METFIIYINGIALNEIGGHYFLDRVEGLLDIPEIRTSQYNYSGDDGGSIPQQFYGMREIGLTGRVHATTAALSETKRKAFVDAIASKKLEIRVITFAGNVYKINANLTSFRSDIDRDTKRKSRFLLQALAPDPLLYDDVDAEIIATIPRKIAGGYPTPYTLPVAWGAATQPIDVVNSGNVPIKPVIEYVGSATNPRMTNHTTGEYIQVNVSTVATDELIVDLKDRSIMLNGGSILSSMSDGSTWFQLEAGSNLLELTTNSGSDTVEGLIKYRSGHIGA